MYVSSVVDSLSPGADVGSVLADLEPDGFDLEGLDELDEPEPVPKNALDSSGRERDRETARISIHSMPDFSDLHMGCLLSQATHLVEGSITIDPA